jgi:hypothetical protein
MRFIAWSLCGLCFVVGCGAQPASESARRSQETSVGAAAMPPGDAGQGSGGEALTGGQTVSADVARKIIYEATLHLVVKDFAAIERELPALVAQFEGYLAEAAVDRTRGSWLSGKWVARIPVAKYGDFVAAVEALGIPERREQTAQDVTEEYVDLEARIANKRKLEERIVGLLDEHSGKIADVIEVERELARVREEIERMQGRLTYLANRTSMTTVTIHIREERDYVPPRAPTFTGRVATVWTTSLETLAETAKVAALVAVAVTPWLLILLAVLIPLTLFIRRRLSRHNVARHSVS